MFIFTAAFLKEMKKTSFVKKKQVFKEEAINAFLRYFPKSTAEGIYKLIKSNCYIPQEGLNYLLLKECSI